MLLVCIKMHGSSATKAFTHHCSLAACSNIPVFCLFLVFLCMVVSFCGLCQLQREVYLLSGLRKGLLIGTGHRAPPHANVSNAGKGQRPQATSTSTPEYVTGPL